MEVNYRRAKLMGWVAWLFCIGVAIAPGVVSAKQINLLATGTQPDEALSVADKKLIRQISDGDKKSASQLLTSELEFVVSFDQIVTAERLLIHFAGQGKSGKASKGKKPGVWRFELLGSLASASTGYQMIRTGTLTVGQSTQSFKFLPAGMQWMMVRLIPGKQQSELALAEVEVQGNVGAPRSRYEFQDSPAQAQQVLSKFRDSLNFELTEREKALFDDAADGNLDTFSLAEAALMASGVHEPGDLTRMLAQIDKAEKRAVKALAKQKKHLPKARSLLGWMHKKYLRKGYVEKQTDLSVLLTKGTYNCVSSALFYTILGRRLGLDVRGIEVPDHAFAIVYDGTSFADVETTTRAGFNPARDRKAQKAFTSLTGFAYIPGSKAAKRRETTPLGLIALVYYNHGVAHSKAKRYDQALQSYFRALSLDPRLVSAVKNSIASLGRWAGQASEAGDNVQALSLLETGLTLAPDDRTLIHNRRVFWQRRIKGAMSQGDFDNLLQITQEAHASDPKAGFDKQQGALFIQRARKLADGAQWQQALKVTSQGIDKVNESSAKSLRRFNSYLVLKWMEGAVKTQDWPVAFQALSQARELVPADSRIRRNAAYLLQEWSAAATRDNGIEAGIAAASQVLTLYPKDYYVKRASKSFAFRQLDQLREQGKLTDPSVIKQFKPLFSDERDLNKLVGDTVNRQAVASIKAKDWPKALAIYESGRELVPGGASKFRSYQQNVAYIAQQWLRSPGADADTLAPDLMARFPDVRKLPDVIGAHYQRRIDKAQKAGDFQGSATAAVAAARVLDDKKNGPKLIRYAYERWAQQLRKKNNHTRAVDVYDEALQALPGDRKLRKNAIATWHMMAKGLIKSKQWQQAIDVYEKGLERFPNVAAFKQNIRYCRQQLKQQ